MDEPTGELRRVTLIAPKVRLDVALPAGMPVAALLPTLLWHSGAELPDEGSVHGGWGLQRAGDDPLETGSSLAALGVSDGEVLYLRPRQDAMPAAIFDDRAEVIAAALRENARRWTGKHSRSAALTATGVMLLAGVILLAVGEHASLVIAGSAGVVAVATVAGAVAASRAFGDVVVAAVLGAGALPYAFVAGRDAQVALVGSGHVGGAAAFAVGAGVVLVTAAVGFVAVGDPGSLLMAAIAGAFVAAACSLIALFTTPAGGAAAAIVVALSMTPAIAPVAYRMAGLPKPEVAATPDELRSRQDEIRVEETTRRSLVADRIVAALVAATGVVTVVGIAIIMPHGGWSADCLTIVGAVLLFLRARVFAGLVQRAWLIGSGLAAVVFFATFAGPGLGLGWLLTVLGLLAAATVVSAAVAMRYRGEPRRSVRLARVSDLFELCAMIAAVPLALEILRVFSFVRTLGG